MAGNEHLLIACVCQRRGHHVGEVLRPLGFDAAKLRDHVRGINQKNKPYPAGSPLNHLTESSKEAIEAAQAAMRASFCGHISTPHLLLGVLDDAENVAVETLHTLGIDIEELKRQARAAIFSDGQIATPQKKFSPAAKQAIERAKKEADECEHSFIGPQHLLAALLPRSTSLAEKVAFGHSIDDPLDKVWPNWPVAEIRRYYQIRWKQDVLHLLPPSLTNLTKNSRKAVAAASGAMLNGPAREISTSHLLLGILDNPRNDAADVLRAANIDVEKLKSEVLVSIAGAPPTSPSREQFSPAARRALQRAQNEAKKYGHSFIGTHHLLDALLARTASQGEIADFGPSVDDPLEKVWPHWPIAEIHRCYEGLWMWCKEDSEEIEANPPRGIKVDWRYAVVGAVWVLVGLHSLLLCTAGIVLAVLLAVIGGLKKREVLRDHWGSFCYGIMVGITLLIIISIFFPALLDL